MEAPVDEANGYFAIKVATQFGKHRIFYHPDYNALREWRVALLHAMGSPGIFKECYRVGEKIGTGLEGRVFRGIDKKKADQEEVAIKIVPIHRRDPYFEIELELLRRLKSPYLIGFRGFYSGFEKQFLVFDYCKEGTLLDGLKPSD